MIKLSRMTDYAVTLLTQMVSGCQDTAMGAAAPAVSTAPCLAEKTGLPLPTVSKILKYLTKAKILEAHRLSQQAGEISIASIIEAMDGPIALTECADGGNHACNVEKICPMSGNWNKVNIAVKHALETVSLADMAASSPLAGEDSLARRRAASLSQTW
jgi:DNA-binding IscR family transcriptional regulator